MIRTQVYLPEDLYNDLRLLASAQSVNFSTLIRKGASYVVKQGVGKKKKGAKWGEGFFGHLKYGPKNLSTKINDIYK